MRAAALRVAICFGTFPPERNGGADFTARFADALAAEGAEVHVLTSPADGRPERETLQSGVIVHRVIAEWRVRGRSLRMLDRLLRTEDVDVLHVLFPDSVVQASYQVPALAGLGHVPLVTTFWNLGLGRRSPMPLRLEAAALLLRSRVLSSHDPGYVSALKRISFGRKHVRWLPVGSNFDVMPGAATRDPGAPLMVGFFGQLDFTRGVDTLFEALARVGRSDIRLRMLGSAGRPERYAADTAARVEFERLRAMPERLGIASCVEWTGFLSDEEVARSLARLDLCVLPYRRNSLGRSGLAAALAAGVPVVLGGRPELIEPLRAAEHVALVPPDDIGALAAEISRLADDPDARRRLAAGARAAASFFAWERIARTALSIYREALR